MLHQDYVQRISIGNIEDDLHRLKDVDWIAEAIVERLDIKKNLYRQIDAVRKPGSIVSSNTSTIPIAMLVENMPGSFRTEFAITHFSNPVRYMRLLEIVRVIVSIRDKNGSFYDTKRKTARYYMEQVLPETAMLHEIITSGADSLREFEIADFVR